MSGSGEGDGVIWRDIWFIFVGQILPVSVSMLVKTERWDIRDTDSDSVQSYLF